MAVSALKLVQTQPFYRRPIEVSDLVAEGELHSLHEVGGVLGGVRPALAAYLIGRFSRPGDVILDPFCGAGAVALEACLARRTAVLADKNPISIFSTQAKLEPADITEVTLWLQLANLRRPVPLGEYEEYFAPFFDVNTYRELVNLKQALRDRADEPTRFIQALTLGLLHGHSAGYFSVYTFPQIALTPKEQRDLNIKRKQVPDYRAVVPRILRRAAALMRDGYPSVLETMSRGSKILRSDARDLSSVTSSSIDLTVTMPPTLSSVSESLTAQQQWLERWFTGMPLTETSRANFDDDSWLDYMNEVLLETARVTRSGGRAVLVLKENDGEAVESALVEAIDRDLGAYWEPEGVLFEQAPAVQLRNSLRPRESVVAQRTHRVLILKRQ